ncbi:MAG: ABC transporter ATP-binding protein [Elusimicrobia bacterium]|nr:ABC transporter ATP-binding protein [Elusimicrobiota bacterium]
MEPSVKTVNLTKKFSDITAVDSLSLEISQGETLGFLGPNGAGKTTTINMLCTLLRPTSGSAYICGIDAVKYPLEVRKKTGIIFQEPSSDDMLTGYENLYLHAMLYGMNKNSAEKKIKEMLFITGLEKRAGDQVRTYSGGMRRRLEIARGLLHEPAVLFLDEPTLGLDPSARREIWSYLGKIKSDRKTTIILTTHYMEEADSLSDRIAVIDRGKIIALDSPSALKSSLGEDLVFLKGKISDQALNLPFITHFEKKGEGYEIAVKGLSKNIKKLLEEAEDVSEIEIRRVSLEDVFLKLTGKKIDEEGKEESGGVFESVVRYNSVRK